MDRILTIHYETMSIQNLAQPKLSTLITFSGAQLTKQVIIIDVKVNDIMVFLLEQKTKDY